VRFGLAVVTARLLPLTSLVYASPRTHLTVRNFTESSTTDGQISKSKCTSNSWVMWEVTLPRKNKNTNISIIPTNSTLFNTVAYTRSARSHGATGGGRGGIEGG